MAGSRNPNRWKLFSIVVLIVLPLAIGLTSFSQHTIASTSQPATNCGDGHDGGVVYVTDFGLQVTDNTNASLPGSGPFVNESTFRRGNVTLSAEGQGSLTLVDAAAPTVCLAQFDAPFVPVRITIDGGPTIILQGRADSFAFGAIDYDPGSIESDLAYASNESLTVQLLETGLKPDTTIQAVSVDSESVITEATVDADGAVSFEFPAMRAQVDLRTTPTPTPIVVTGANQTVTAETTATGTTPSGTSSAIGNQTTVPDQPGFGIALTVGVLFAMLLLAGRRHRS